MTNTHAVRDPTSKGKWHLIAYDWTYDAYQVGDDWLSVPIDTLPPDDICRNCRRAARML